MTSIYIDFLAKQITYRRKQLSLKKELIARALGLKKNPKLPLTIIDATAGLAQDSFILACLGFEVKLLERSPMIYAALQDGLLRAQQDQELNPIVSRMHLILADSIDYLTHLPTEQYPDIIYLDPMFPERKKTALNKKNMRILHEIVGEDPDANQLLLIALTCALKRVVVKRPLLAEPLALVKPSYSLKGSSNRFDIYLTK